MKTIDETLQGERMRERKVSGQYVISVSIPIEPTLPPHNIIMVIISISIIGKFWGHAMNKNHK